MLVWSSVPSRLPADLDSLEIDVPGAAREFEFRLSVTSIFRSRYPVFKVRRAAAAVPGPAARGITIRAGRGPAGGDLAVHGFYTNRL